ncbi:hypothetical protein [Haloplanus pelagicus]|jgi:hypothetical protein|uniref:hypothetical protein n=1 Tax=Haloplanus pelagicus TaxID=2949995 RepID=UPI0020414540|nr:hypothetical protein [Haloplanus sp. HW8-1]
MRDRVCGTPRGVAAALRRSDGRAAFLLAVVGYPPLYLASIGHLVLGARGYSIRVVSAPLARALQSTRSFSFEPIARITVDPVALLVSPLDVGIALLLAILVGCNLAVGVVAWRAPAVCGVGVGKSAGVLAGLPALLTGATCCGPAVLFVVGVGTTGTLVSAVQYATPVAGLLLVGSLLVVAGRRTQD